MLWLASQCYTPVTLCRLDLNFSTILTDGIMAWVRVGIQIKPIRVGSKYFSKTSDKMAVWGKFFIFGLKQQLQFSDHLVQVTYKSWDFSDRRMHV